MGFEPKVRKVLHLLRERQKEGMAAPQRQNIMVSATMDSRVQKLASLSLENPMFLDAVKHSKCFLH